MPDQRIMNKGCLERMSKNLCLKRGSDISGKKKTREGEHLIIQLLVHYNTGISLLTRVNVVIHLMKMKTEIKIKNTKKKTK